MTTQYGERPGMTGTARREPWPFGMERIAAAICAVNNGISLSPLTCYDMAHALETLTRERDAARAECERMRAALVRAHAAMTAGARGCHKPAQDAMLADAILEAGAALRATEAGSETGGCEHGKVR